MTRKRERRQRVEPEDTNLEHLVAGCDHLTGRKVASVGDHDDARGRGLRAVIHVQDRLDLDGCTDFFATLADDSFGRALIVVDEAAGQTPQTVAGIYGAPAEDHSEAGLDHDGGRDLGVTPEHEVIVWARL
jgi:hypothetical protein